MAIEVRSGERIVFWGDSITDNSYWARTVENYIRAVNPGLRFDIINLGWGGDVAVNVKRMERDLPQWKPTLVFIKLGMNDGLYKPYEDSIGETYLKGLRGLYGVAKKTGARIVFMTPTCYEDGVKKDEAGALLDKFYNKTLRTLSDKMIAFALEMGCPVIDMNMAYAESIAHYKKEIPGKVFSDDSVHPDCTGNALIATILIQTLDVGAIHPELVLDLKTNRLLSSKGVKIRGLKPVENGLEWMMTPQTFPMLFAAEEIVSIPLLPLKNKLHRFPIKAKNLLMPYYVLQIDGHPFRVLSREELEAGYNIYELSVPEKETSQFLAGIIDEKVSTRYVRWRRHQTRFCVGPNDYTPYRAETLETEFLHEKAELCIKFLNSGRVRVREYQMALIGTTEKTLYHDKPFNISPPFPELGEVQILFTIDVNGWKDLLSPNGQSLSFKGPLRFKSPVTNWVSVPMYDNGENGDEKAGDGVWSLVLNCPRSDIPVVFALDDESEPRSNFESMLTEVIKTAYGALPGLGANGLPSFVPDDFKIFRLTKEHFEAALSSGLLRKA